MALVHKARPLFGGQMQISTTLQAYANGGSHSNLGAFTIPSSRYKKFTLDSVKSSGNGGYPKSYTVKINGIAIGVKAGTEVNIEDADILNISLEISALESQYLSYGFTITFTLS